MIAALRGDLEAATASATRSEEAVTSAAAAATNGAVKGAAGPSPEPHLVPKPQLK